MTRSPMAQQALTLATVIDHDDPNALSRVKIRLAATEQELWAQVATNSAGPDYGVHCLPRLDETVVVAFVQGGNPVVLGSVWTGAGGPSGVQEPIEEKYSMVSPAGHEVVIDDASPGSIQMKTSQGSQLTISDSGPGSVEIDVNGTTVTVEGTGNVTIQAGGTVNIQGSDLTVDAGMVTVNSAVSNFSGVVSCDVLQTNSVISTSYTPGAGNVW